jgi:hypothetical protein
VGYALESVDKVKSAALAESEAERFYGDVCKVVSKMIIAAEPLGNGRMHAMSLEANKWVERLNKARADKAHHQSQLWAYQRALGAMGACDELRRIENAVTKD